MMMLLIKLTPVAKVGTCAMFRKGSLEKRLSNFVGGREIRKMSRKRGHSRDCVEKKLGRSFPTNATSLDQKLGPNSPRVDCV
jgi:hypothetical protein